MESPYTCTLSAEMLEKARIELNEDPATRMTKMAELRDKLHARQDLKPRTDPGFLLRFLRARKFDVNRAYELVINYYKIRYQNPEFFVNFVPLSVAHTLDDGLSCVFQDQHGRPVVYVRNGLWHPDKYSLEDMFKMRMMWVEYALLDEAAQVTGTVSLLDAEGVGVRHLRTITSGTAKKFMSYLVDALPVRVKEIHLIRESTLFDMVFALFKPFMKSKMITRMKTHGWNLATLHQSLDPQYLPKELGGQDGPIDPMACKQTLLGAEQELAYNNQFGFLVDPDKAGQSLSSRHDAIEGTMGSFRKLSVD